MSEIEKANHIWAEFEYHHDHFWRSFYRLTAAVVAVIIIPYAPFVPSSFRSDLGDSILMFPLIGVSVGVFGSWLLMAEYWRLKKVSRALSAARKSAEIEYEWVDYPKLYSFEIGSVMAGSLAIASAGLGVISGVDLLTGSSEWLLWVAAPLIVALVVVVAVALTRRSLEQRQSD